LNGDGFADIALPLALPYENQPAVPSVYVYLGGVSGPATTAIPLTTPSGSQFGLGIAGDVNSDGFADLVVGGRAAAYVFEGRTNGVASSPVTLAAPNPLDEKYFGTGGVQ
jgi:hypothetical protein